MAENLHFHSSKFQLTQESQHSQRRRFVNWFIDEAHFQFDGCVNKLNFRIHEKRMHPQSSSGVVQLMVVFSYYT